MPTIFRQTDAEQVQDPAANSSLSRDRRGFTYQLEHRDSRYANLNRRQTLAAHSAQAGTNHFLTFRLLCNHIGHICAIVDRTQTLTHVHETKRKLLNGVCVNGQLGRALLAHHPTKKHMAHVGERGSFRADWPQNGKVQTARSYEQDICSSIAIWLVFLAAAYI